MNALDMNQMNIDAMMLMWKQQGKLNKTDGYGQPADIQSPSFADTAIKALQQHQTEEVSETQSLSLEERLKARYPGLVYHVFDGSSSYWRTRNDYPHYLLYQEHVDAEALENWEPKGPNPAYGASKAIRALGSVPPGKKAVVIHPKVQERMEKEPEYADEIMARIEAWFTFDVARNEAIMPGCTADMAQSIVIGEDGNIANVCASTPGRITYSKSGGDEEYDFWGLRLKRHAYYMDIWQEEQIQHGIEVSGQFTAFGARQAAKAHFVELINNGELKAALGDEICGIPTEEVFAESMRHVEKGVG